MGSVNIQSTRSTLTSVDTTLSENITATQNYIPVASTINFSTSIVAEIESTNEIVSFTDISKNNYIRSEEFDNASWIKNNCTITANSTADPNGDITADALIENAGVGTKNVYRATNFVTGTQYTISVFAKTNGRFLQLTTSVLLGGTTTFVNFNLTTGTLGTVGAGVDNATIEDYGNGWFRCSLTSTSLTTSATAYNICLIKNDTVFSGARNPSYTGDGTSGIFIWGAQIEEASSPSLYLPTTTSPLEGLTGVTRGVNGTTAASASSGDSIQQLPYALGSLDMPVRLKAISVSPDGTGAARLTLCDNNGDTLCDVDIPNAKSYTLNMPEDGIIFPNGVFVSNTDNITAYTVYTEKYSGPSLTS
jgi:hypothetical protein